MTRRLPAVLLLLFLGADAFAAARITYDVRGVPTPIGWTPTAFPLRYEVDERLAALGASVPRMIDRAFAVWAAVPDTLVQFESLGVVPGARARADERLVVTLADELLRNQGAIAMTTFTWDTSNGNLLDADISVDPELFKGRFDAQTALAHEVGHMLGLDHSAVLSSVMYPWIGPAGGTSDLDSDDRIAIAAIYPRADPGVRGATLQGKVFGDQGAIFGAQVVAVNEAGQPVGTTLTNAMGEFVLTGVPPGTYRLYTEPLDGPVSAQVLQGSWRLADARPFPTRFFGPPITVESGTVVGNLVVTTAGPVELNPRLIGAALPDAVEIGLSTTPVHIRPGDTVKLTVGGDGFVSGMTEFEVLNPAFRRVSDFSWWSGAVSALFTVDPRADPASVVVLVRSGQETTALTGALRVYRTGKSRSAGR